MRRLLSIFLFAGATEQLLSLSVTPHDTTLPDAPHGIIAVVWLAVALHVHAPVRSLVVREQRAGGPPMPLVELSDDTALPEGGGRGFLEGPATSYRFTPFCK